MVQVVSISSTHHGFTPERLVRSYVELQRRGCTDGSLPLCARDARDARDVREQQPFSSLASPDAQRGLSPLDRLEGLTAGLAALATTAAAPHSAPAQTSEPAVAPPRSAIDYVSLVNARHTGA